MATEWRILLMLCEWRLAKLEGAGTFISALPLGAYAETNS